MFSIGGFLDSLDTAAKETLEEETDKGPSATWIRSQRKGGSSSNVAGAVDDEGFPVPVNAPSLGASHQGTGGIGRLPSASLPMEAHEVHALSAIATDDEVSATPYAKGSSPVSINSNAIAYGGTALTTNSNTSTSTSISASTGTIAARDDVTPHRQTEVEAEMGAHAHAHNAVHNADAYAQEQGGERERDHAATTSSTSDTTEEATHSSGAAPEAATTTAPAVAPSQAPMPVPVPVNSRAIEHGVSAATGAAVLKAIKPEATTHNNSEFSEHQTESGEIERLNAECLELEDEITGLKAEASSAWAAYKRVQETANVNESEIKKEKDAAEAELESMQQEIDDALKAQKAAEAQIENAESIIASLEEANKQQQEEVNRLKANSSGSEETLRVDLRKAVESSERLRLEHATLTSQAQRRQAALEATNTQLSASLAEAKRDSQMQSKQMKPAAAGSAAESLQDDLEEQKQHQRRLREELSEREREMSLLQTNLLSMQESAHQVSSQLEDEREKAKATAANHARQLAVLEERALQAQASAAKSGTSGAASGVGPHGNDASDEMRGVQAQVANLSQQLLRKQQHVLELQAERSTLRSRLDDAQANAQAAERQVLELRGGDVEDLEGGYSTYGRSINVGMSRRGGVSPGTASKGKGGSRIVQEMEKFGVNAGPGVTRTIDALDSWSLDVGRVLRTHPLIRIGAVLYLIVIHLWVFFILSMQTHTLDEGGAGLSGLSPHDFVNTNLGEFHQRVDPETIAALGSTSA